MAARYRVNTPSVVAETLDGETTIVDLDNGTYYALNESGSLIWDSLAAGATADAVAHHLGERYGVDAGQISADVDALLAELSGYNLIVADTGEATGQPALNGAVAGAYEAPKLSAYTDMQELLLLDPIHEVDESGWPHPA